MITLLHTVAQGPDAFWLGDLPSLYPGPISKSRLAARSTGWISREMEDLIVSLFSFRGDNVRPCKTFKKRDQALLRART